MQTGSGGFYLRIEASTLATSKNVEKHFNLINSSQALLIRNRVDITFCYELLAGSLIFNYELVHRNPENSPSFSRYGVILARLSQRNPAVEYV